MKKQRTEWLWKYVAAYNTGMRIGWTHHKTKGNPADKIRLQIKSLTGYWDFSMRIDEALAVIMGLSKVMAVQSMAKRIIVENEKAKRSR